MIEILQAGRALFGEAKICHADGQIHRSSKEEDVLQFQIPMANAPGIQAPRLATEVTKKTININRY